MKFFKKISKVYENFQISNIFLVGLTYINLEKKLCMLIFYNDLLLSIHRVLEEKGKDIQKKNYPGKGLERKNVSKVSFK